MYTQEKWLKGNNYFFLVEINPMKIRDIDPKNNVKYLAKSGL